MNERYRTIIVVAAIVAVAAVLRLWGLDRHALWWDEGNNAYFAHQSPARLLEMSRLTHDTNPPAHRLALAVWLRLLGDSAFNLRLLSVVLGLATVALLFVWGRELGGTLVGLGAALLTALSPMMIYYSREAKGYPFVTFFGLLALYLWASRLQTDKPSHPVLWVVYVLAETLALGAHYYAIFLVIAQGVWVVISVLTGGAARGVALRRAGQWLLAQAVVAIFLLPWVLATLPTALKGAKHVVPSDYEAMPRLEYLLETLLSFAAGPIAHNWRALLALAILGVSALLGIAFGVRARMTWLLVICTWLPISLAFFAQSRLPFFYARFLLYVSPLFYLLSVLGLVRLGKVGALLGGVLLLAWASILPSAYVPFQGPEEDMRPLAQTLREQSEPSDVVVVGYIWQEGILRMYAPNFSGRYELGWYSPETVEAQMRDLFAAHPRLWLVTYGAPLQHQVANPSGYWLEQNAVRVLVTESGKGRVVLYQPYPEATTPSRRVRFEEGIELAYMPFVECTSAGQPIVVALYWQVNAPVSRPYSVFVHVGDDGLGKIRGQHDGQPVNSMRPFTTFVPGQVVLDCHAVVLGRDVPPGRYRVTVGLYCVETGERLTIVDGPEAGNDHCVVGKVELISR